MFGKFGFRLDCENLLDNDYDELIDQEGTNVESIAYQASLHDVQEREFLSQDESKLSEDDSKDNEPLSMIKQRLDAQKSTDDAKRKSWLWKKMGVFIPQTLIHHGVTDTIHETYNWKVEDYISIYFDNSEYENICNCTNIRYLEENGKPMNLTVAEIRKFFGISILMSCFKYPQIKMYWAKLTKVNSIAYFMTRVKYFQIRSNLKVVIDTDVSENERKADKLFKIRPLMEKIKKGFLSHPRYSEVAVDEQMIPFTRTCNMQQFVRGKPNPVELKDFVCATPKGLVLDFELYQGKHIFLQNEGKHLGVGPSALVRLATRHW